MARLSFFALLLTAVVAHMSLMVVPTAHALQGMDLTPPMIKRAEHVNLNQRMIKKKRQADDVPVNAGEDLTTTSTRPTSTAATPPPTGALPSIISSPSPGTSAPSSVTTTTGTTTTTSGTTSSTTSGSSSSTTSSSVSSQSTSSATSSTQTSTRRTQSTVLVTQTAASQPVDVSQDQTASFLPKSVIIGLIVTGSCIAAGAAIWTIIRKWKFSPSRHFEDRLEPINWEPTQASGLSHDPTVAALERASSRNAGSATGRGSLGSNDEHGSRNMSSVNHDQISMAPDFPPAHDFTAGPSSGGYGQGAGYVDMHRGPSPAPGAYATPNPYDAYDYNNQAYGQRRY